jgi:capsid protein
MVSLNPFNWFKKSDTEKNKDAFTIGSPVPAPFQFTSFNGEKFPTGFGTTELQFIDYWTLRARSVQLFNSNLYARGLIRRLVTNEINTGLTLECTPDPLILGIDEETLNDWTEAVETRFTIWGKNHRLCDHRKQMNFSELQKQSRMEALIAGDVLVVIRQNRRTNLPEIQLIKGESVRTPLGGGEPREGNHIRHGVELDSQMRHVAYWVKERDGSSKRLPTYGERSGRRIAWLYYGTDKRLDEVRGQPILSLVLQSLKEIDRYRDAVQRKALINATLAMFIKKTEDKMGSLPITGGAIRRDTAITSDGNGTQREFSLAGQIPGLVLEELQQGEEPVGFNSTGTDLAFGEFEQAILHSIAWANEISPEILLLSFQNNYSASQSSINEFKIYLNRVRDEFASNFCQPIYTEWLISETLLQNINAPGFLDSWRNSKKYAEFGSWISSDFSGAIKPSTDIKKQAQGYELLNGQGWITNDRASKELTGTKFSKNIKRIRRENEMKVAAALPLAEFKAKFGDQIATDAISATEKQHLQLVVDNEHGELGDGKS